MSFSWNLGLKFREVAHANAERPLLLQEGEKTKTYAEMDSLANQIARLLLQRGLRRGDVVALFHDKSPPAFAAMLACLKAGLIYTNLDPESPWKRLQKILQTCEPKAIVNGFLEFPHWPSLSQLRPTLIDLRRPEITAELSRLDSNDLTHVSATTGADPAYIMFTSGSTGTPKGAVVSPANLL